MRRSGTDAAPAPLRLVPFGSEHFATLIDWFRNEAEMVQWGGTAISWPLTEDQLAAMLDEGAGAWPRRRCWMARLDERSVGHVQLAFDWRNGNARLSRVAIAPASRGSGLAVPMLRFAVAQAFAVSEVQRLELNVYELNTVAIRVYEHLGFKREGCRRQAVRVGAERWSTVTMGLLRAELNDPLAGPINAS